jgi:two-component system, NtrC family, response regulator AtoC
MDAVKQPGFADIIGSSQAMRHIVQMLQQIANTPLNTLLLLGETGTGKDLIAKVLHHESHRAKYPFVEVNCMAVPETLLEAELFGYEAGAFTDAKRARDGLVSKANRGTLFLNEIGDISIGSQVKILRLIEDRVYRKLGSVEELESDVRIIAATSRDLDSLVRSRQFKVDLYYRLNVFSIDVPPLRERTEDVLPLAQHYMQQYGTVYDKSLDGFSRSAEALLLRYPWPGNVRELRNVVERTVMLHEGGDIVGPHHLPLHVQKLQPLLLHGTEASNLPEAFAALAQAGLGLDEMEERMITIALQVTAGNVSRAAKRLKVGRSALIGRMKKYHIAVSQQNTGEAGDTGDDAY